MPGKTDESPQAATDASDEVVRDLKAPLAEAPPASEEMDVRETTDAVIDSSVEDEAKAVGE